MKTLYHGTSSRNLSSIKSIGLVPGHAKGGDTWAAEHGRKTLAALAKKREPSVFLADDVVNAEYFARIAAEEMGGDPIVVTVRVPAQVFAKFVVDELYESDPGAAPSAWRAHRVDAEYVTEVLPVSPEPPEAKLMHALMSLLAAAATHREEELA